MYLQADTYRVGCAEHGVVVAHVPWARPGARFSTAFEDTTAWLLAHAALSVVAVLLRIAWRSVAAIVTRVVADAGQRTDRLAGPRTDRHRRDLLPQGPAVLVGGGRP